MSRIPASAPPDVQQSMRELWAAIDRLGNAGALNVDLSGKRMINAGDAVDQTDYVTLRQLAARAVSSAADQLRTLVVTGVARFLSTVFVTTIDDASIVFTKTSGQLAGDNEKLSWRYSNDSLRLGASVNVRWHHLAELRSPATGVLELSGEDHDVSNSFARIAFGLDNSSHPALVRNGDGFDIRVAGAAGALSDLTLDTLTATTVNAGNIPATGSDPTFGDVTADKFIATGRQTYNETIGGNRRTFDSTTVTLPELAEVVGTMIRDLDAIGLMDT